MMPGLLPGPRLSCGRNAWGRSCHVACCSDGVGNGSVESDECFVCIRTTIVEHSCFALFKVFFFSGFKMVQEQYSKIASHLIKEFCHCPRMRGFVADDSSDGFGQTCFVNK